MISTQAGVKLLKWIFSDNLAQQKADQQQTSTKMGVNAQSKQADKLIIMGLILFLLGLIIGLFVHNMVNPRMALSAHLEAVMNGMFLVVLGLIWKRLLLSMTVLTVTFWLAIYGTFANLAAVMIAAVTGYGKMMPIAGGKEGAGSAETLISFLLISLALCMISVCILVLTGFYKSMKHSGTE